MNYLLDQIDYWTDQLDAARLTRNKARAIVCGGILAALRRYKQEVRRF